MQFMIRWFLLAIVTAAILCVPGSRADDPGTAPLRDTAAKQFGNGNFKDALEAYIKLATDPQDDPAKVGDDLVQALQCLNNLGRIDEGDDLREKVITIHANNWQLLAKAGDSMEQFGSYGFIVAGKFYRGNHRGNDGKYVMTIARDRVRALQLYQQAMGRFPEGLAKTMTVRWRSAIGPISTCNSPATS